MKIIFRLRWVILGIICILGLALRLYGLAWDQGNAIQPDERQLLFVAMQFGWPHSWAEFFSAQSPLAPHAFGQRFFAYGTFPMYLLALLGYGFHIRVDDIVAWSYLGRVVSAIFDSGTILVTALLALRLLDKAQPARRWGCALLVAVLVAFTPLQLQLSHFFAVDTILLFFVMLTLLGCIYIVETKRIWLWSLMTGVACGLALGTKVSALPLAVPILVAFLLRLYRQRDWYEVLIGGALVIAMTGIVFVLVEPYVLIDWTDFYQRFQFEGDIAHGVVDVPYTRQFAGTIPYIYELENMVVWGIGLLLGVVGCIAFCWFIGRVLRGKFDSWLVILSWIIVYGVIICGFYVKYMRYMLPVYPLFTLMAVVLLAGALSVASDRLIVSMPVARVLPVLSWVVIILVLGGTLFQGLALLNVYGVPNTRVQASRWMYSHLRPGSILTYEAWDDPLPYAVDGHDPSEFTQYTYQDSAHNMLTGLNLYDDDTNAKAQQLASVLSQVDVITMATDRLDKSIPRSPARYPLTIHYYQLLFQGQLGFRLAVAFENHPHLFGITLDDSNADESYSVFDHPTTRIFVRNAAYTPDQLYQKLMAGVQLP